MRERSSDQGFSLVEVLIAMFLLAVLSLAVLPLIVSATALSVTNRSVVEATAFADSRLAALKDQFPTDPTVPTSCATLRTHDATTAADPLSGMTATTQVSGCPADFPASVPVSVTVADATGAELTELTTRIPVTAP